MRDVECGKGKLTLHFEPDECLDGKASPAFTIKGEGYLSVSMENDLIEGPSSGPYVEYIGTIPREYKFSLSPPTGPLTVQMHEPPRPRRKRRKKK